MVRRCPRLRLAIYDRPRERLDRQVLQFLPRLCVTDSRLRDVRPYLYLVGFWTPLSVQERRDLEKNEVTMVEDEYVKLGREYLMKQREMGRG
jgi:hypothetical protein